MKTTELDDKTELEELLEESFGPAASHCAYVSRRIAESHDTNIEIVFRSEKELKNLVQFTNEEELLDLVENGRLVEHFKLLWEELICRLYLSSVLSSARLDRWLKLVALSIREKNFLGFAAGLRGSIESMADYSYSRINYHLEVLGMCAAEINKIFDEDKLPIPLLSLQKVDKKNVGRGPRVKPGDPDTPWIQVFEDDLIHFTHARHMSGKDMEASPESHIIPRNLKEYFKWFNQGDGGALYKLYSELSEFTHPSLKSMVQYWHPVDETDGSRYKILLAQQTDEAMLEAFLDEYAKTFSNLATAAPNLAQLTLVMINHLPITYLNSDFVRDWDPTGEFDIWESIGRRLKQDNVQNRWRKSSRAKNPSLPKRPKSVPGRNDPCYCGSGKKFKKCCGRSGMA